MNQFRRKKEKNKIILPSLFLICFFLFLTVRPCTLLRTKASYVDTNLNTFIHDAEETQTGVIGQDMQLHVRIGYNGVNGLYNPATDEISNVRVRLSNDQNYLANSENAPGNYPRNNPYDSDSDDDSEMAAHDAYNEGWRAGIQRAYNASLGLTYPVDGGRYPFEVNASIFTQEQSFEVLRKGEYVEAVFNVFVRSDTEQGYYGIPLTIWYDVAQNSSGSYGSLHKTEFVNVYISTAGEVVDPGITKRDSAFVIGEDQATPQCNYPDISEFSVKMRNQTGKPLYDVLVHMNMYLDGNLAMQPTAAAKASADKGFPFSINESNYDRFYEEVGVDGIISPPYSMAIKPNAASGYYPLFFNVSYKQTPGATVAQSENFYFYVNVYNLSMIDPDESLREFNENDRSRARLIVDSYRTIPEKVFAGERFTLSMIMKNASTDIAASNILLTLESAKENESPVFTIEGGANSMVLNSLSAGESREVKVNMTVAAGVNPKSYSLTINEKYDSPEYKNASEKVEIDIPVNQVARLSCSNFEIMPEEIETGGESNVMFGINNTGKVMLYNVEAVFEADSIKKASSYVGNIKPGESGNVDVMLEGVAQTLDEGVIPVKINFEDVNGNPFSQETSIKLYVSEVVEEEPQGLLMETEEVEQENGIGSLKKYLHIIIPSAVVAILFLFIIIRRRKRKRKDIDEDI